MAYLVRLCILCLLYMNTVVSAQPVQCTPTPGNFLGNSHVPGVATYKADIGSGLKMKGRVLSATNCTPIPDAVIEHWQAGNQGHYEDRLRSLRKTTADGQYQFETDWPNMSIPHIHFIVSANGYERLVTQWIPDSKTNEAIFDLVLKPLPGIQ